MLRSAGTLLLGGAVGAVTTSSIATESVQAADTDLQVAGDSVTVRGSEIAAVPLSLAAEWAYAAPSGERPATLELTLLAGRSEDDLQAVATSTSDQAFLESSGEESFEVDLLGEGIVDADTLVPDDGGTTRTTELVVGVEMQLFDESDMVIAADSHTTTVALEVTKSDYDPDEHGDVAASGSVTIELA